MQAESRRRLRQLCQGRDVLQRKQAHFGESMVVVRRQRRLHVEVGIAAVVDESGSVAFMFSIQCVLNFPASVLHVKTHNHRLFAICAGHTSTKRML